MERFSRAHPATPRDHSKTNSMASLTSTSTRTTNPRDRSADSASSRPTSYTPSYMNAIPARKPVSPRPPPPQPTNGHTAPSRRTPSTSSGAQKGALFLFIADTIHPATLPYLETMLRRGAYSSIAVVGAAAQEQALKNLKIQIYALLGKLSHSSVGVEMRTTRDGWSESGVRDVVDKAMKVSGSGDSVNGVLCSPVYGGEQAGDIMALDAAHLQSPWAASVGFLHAVAKTTIPKMQTSAGLFAVTGPTGSSPVARFYKGACEALIELLSEDAATSGVAIVRAENVLVPEPEPAVEAMRRESPEKAREGVGRVNGIPIPAKNGLRGGEKGWGYGSGNGEGEDEFVGGESPTKLWNMWALHEQLGAD